VLEFESTALAPPPSQVLDEIAATGYEGTELGEWGFLGTDAPQLRADLDQRCLALVGAFIAVPLSKVEAHAAGEAAAVRTARLIAAAGSPSTMLVLSDATAAVTARTAKAGRISAADGLAPDEWRVVAAGAERLARAIFDATGLATAFHHHCATYVETSDEIDALMDRTSVETLGLCLDTGHAMYAGADPLGLISRYGSRIRHVHFKDCSAAIARTARHEQWDYLTALRHGVFCELGAGQVNFAAVLSRLRGIGYDGWIVVEQDVLPSTGNPAASAARNRAFLRNLGI
jgi:inosose dehydratase